MKVFRLFTLKRMLSEARAGASRRDIDFNLNLSDLRRIHKRSGGVCEVTGVKFSDEDWGGWRRPFRMSIDRIDNREPYTLLNCRLVCVAANIAMGEWGEEVLVRMLRSMMDEIYDVETYAMGDSDDAR